MKVSDAGKWWMYFRTGHSIYLAFLFSITNFVILIFRIFIEKTDLPIFDKLIEFAFFFMLLYIPTAIAVGHWHRKSQYKVESDIKFLQNPYFSRVIKTLIDIKLGIAEESEVKKIRDELKRIESKSNNSEKSKK